MDALPVQTITEIGNRYKNLARLILILVIAALITYVVFRIVRAFKKPANATYVPGGGELPSGWDPTQMTDQLFDVIDGTLVLSGTMQDVFGDFNKLNDNQMISVYNKWNQEGYDEEKKYFVYPLGSLTKAIKDKVGYASIGVNQKTLAEINLDRLHLK